MTPLRQLLRQQRWLALWLVGFALALRIVVPAGYMPVFSGHALTIELCSGYGPVKMTMTVAGMDMSDAGHTSGKQHHDKTDSPCPFSGLTTPALSGADPILLAAAILFIMLLASRRPITQPVRAGSRLRPPLRGPPFRF